MLKNTYLLITILVLSIFSDLHAQNNTIDVVLLAGQSNMKGRGLWADINPTSHPADQDTQVMMLQSGQMTGANRIGDFKSLAAHIHTGTNEPSFGLGIPLARKLYDAGYNKIATINGAVGGSNILDWQKGDTLYDNFMALITDGINDLENAGYTVNILGFGWLQGEANNIAGTTSADYLVALTSLISDLKNDVQALLPTQDIPNMKVVLMEPCYGGIAQNVIPNAVDGMIAYVQNSDHNAVYIETRDITDRISEGNLHWGAIGVTEVGTRLFNALTNHYIAEPNANNYIDHTTNLSGVYARIWSGGSSNDLQDYNDNLGGQTRPLKWDAMEPSPGQYDFSLLQQRLQSAVDNNHSFYTIIWTGPHAPSWIYDQGVPEVIISNSNGWSYPDYKNETYKYLAKRFYKALVDELATYTPAQIAAFAFMQPGFGATGDRQLFKGKPDDVQYRLTEEEYVAYMQEMTKAVTTYFWENPKTENFRFRWNIDDYDGPIDAPNIDEEAVYGGWMKENYNCQLRKQQFTIAIGYMSPNEQDQDDELRDSFFGNDPNRWDGNPEFVTGEFEEARFAAGTPIHELNPKANFYWTSIASVDRGMDGWELDYAYLDPKFTESYEFSNRYSFFKKSETSPVAFIALRDVLDYSDDVRFPVNVYGPADRSNQARIDAILADFTAYGAANDDSNAVKTLHSANYIQFADGYNDCNWNVIARNYRRFITQINPNTTSKGYWRVGMQNSNSQPYGRFARGFDTASNNNTMYFDVDDAYFADEIQNNQGGLKVKVIYYEDDGGSWRFRYRAQDGTMKTAGTVVNDAAAGNGWSSIEFLIEDAKLDNGGAFGSDFILKNIGSTNVRFHLIELDSRVDTSLSINDVSATDSVAISVTPNPTAGIFTINTGNSSIKNVIIRDIQGRIIRELNGNENTKMKLDIADLNSAIYFVTIQTENGNQSLKIVKK